MAIPTQPTNRNSDLMSYATVSAAADTNDIFTVLSSELLLKGEYSRSGDDLVIRGAMGEEIRVEGYFSGDVPPTLQTADGAAIIPEIVEKLLVNTDSVQVAGPAGSIAIPEMLGDPIGAVDTVGKDGNITAKGSDGVIRILKEGDPIYKDDVIETEGNSTIGLKMLDDTSFQMGASTRAILDEYNYNAATETGRFEATILEGVFRYASGHLGGLDKGTHTVLKTPTAQLGVRGSELEGQVTADGTTTFVHREGILDVSDAWGRGSVTLVEPGTASAVSFRPGPPEPIFEAPEAITQIFEEMLPPVPDFVIEANEAEAAEEEPEEEATEEEVLEE
ncbi:MAG TPA: hypothetical protein HPP91_04785, partial [Gammaproteobacteria bacterium]|nr:hypothetical protein [Gammaproteobacteria bacterium]